ncbi:hypothetical protein [Pseudomonas sp. P8_241]|uniref:hypothetical protein n=1 Tax=Pseudomonas sp. P8_241 TaxID=3043445 RepID=UPI002A36D4E7|nr:hypothetical protein [Pseudomonas sp. P8_241]WPN45120.1 hypothetical protein QMK58_18235 [Pseudomonas sp. P8_241]
MGDSVVRTGVLDTYEPCRQASGVLSTSESVAAAAWMQAIVSYIGYCWRWLLSSIFFHEAKKDRPQ